MNVSFECENENGTCRSEQDSQAVNIGVKLFVRCVMMVNHTV